MEEVVEQQFLEIMLDELDVKFTLQLDVSLIMDWSCQNATGIPADNNSFIV